MLFVRKFDGHVMDPLQVTSQGMRASPTRGESCRLRVGLGEDHGIIARVMRVAVFLLFSWIGSCAHVGALEVRLASPLCTMVDVLAEFPANDAVLSAEILVPADAPADLLVTGYAQEDGGAWRQAYDFVTLKPGLNRIAMTIPGRLGAAPTARAIAGLVFSSMTGSGLAIQITNMGVIPVADVTSERLYDFGYDDLHVVTGTTWSLHVTPGSRSDFRLVGSLTSPDGKITELVGVAGAYHWVLPWTPSQPGTYQLAVQARSQGRVIELPSLVLDVIGSATQVASGVIAPVPMAHAGRGLQLQSPLRSCVEDEITDGFAACRVSARVQVGDDAPADLTLGAFAVDHVGRWRQSAVMIPLHPGEHLVELLVPAGIAAFDALAFEHGSGAAGLVCWSAHVSTAWLPMKDFRIEQIPGGSTGIVKDAIGLDRLRLEGVKFFNGGMTASVGSTWAASVEPTQEARKKDQAHFSLSARLIDPDGHHQIVAGKVDPMGRYRVEFHPTLPGVSSVSLIGHWSDGREVESSMSFIQVLGEHPCPHGYVIPVQGPLTRIVPLAMGPVGERNRVEATVVVPDGAPHDLTAAVVAIDHDHRWYQQARPQPLLPGINHLSFLIDRGADLASEPAAGTWSASQLSMMEKSGLAISTASSVLTRIIVQGAVSRPSVDPAPAIPVNPVERLVEITTSASTVTTGERWNVSLRPAPFPTNPYDPEEFRLDVLVTTPDGQQLLVPGFYSDEMTPSDRGDIELLRPATGGFHVRYRPRTPGVHHLEVQAQWRNGRRVQCALPPLEVSGAPWDGYVRVDSTNPRFFAVDGKFFWPVGPNLRSVWDLRAQERMHTKVTPDRGSLAYDAYLKRFAAAGANACEIWMSAWNLALEWRSDWPGFYGVGRYNQSNAWRLDQILDAAWESGVRVNLVINNHGQASEKTDAEWTNNPYNRAAGGQLQAAAELFQNPWALKGQDNLRRYLIARYADHPAVMGWKLWTEMDLTNGGPNLKSWHDRATKRWRELDVYGHPVASHWCGDFTHPTEDIVSLLDYVCIDAYHGDEKKEFYHLVLQTVDLLDWVGRFW